MAKNKRLDLIASLTQGYHTVCDIGTDHGLVLYKAFKKKYIQKGIAADLREGPLNQARKQLKDYPVTFVLSDGFKSIKTDFDLGIIAGMGAMLITDILKHAPKGKTYLLQANEKYEILRAYLNNNHYEIIDEHIVFDKFYYVVMVVKDGAMDLKLDDLILGPILKTKKEARPYYQQKIKQIENIYNQTPKTKQSELDELMHLYKNHL